MQCIFQKTTGSICGQCRVCNFTSKKKGGKQFATSRKERKRGWLRRLKESRCRGPTTKATQRREKQEKLFFRKHLSSLVRLSLLNPRPLLETAPCLASAAGCVERFLGTTKRRKTEKKQRRFSARLTICFSNISHVFLRLSLSFSLHSYDNSTTSRSGPSRRTGACSRRTTRRRRWTTGGEKTETICSFFDGIDQSIPCCLSFISFSRSRLPCFTSVSLLP